MQFIIPLSFVFYVQLVLFVFSCHNDYVHWVWQRIFLGKPSDYCTADWRRQMPTTTCPICRSPIWLGEQINLDNIAFIFLKNAYTKGTVAQILIYLSWVTCFMLMSCLREWDLTVRGSKFVLSHPILFLPGQFSPATVTSNPTHMEDGAG